MGKTITFINEKGGIGKTSCCFNIAWELSLKKKILMIDLDGQRANLTYFCGIKKPADLLTIFDVLRKGKDIHEVILPVKDNLDLVPATVDVSSLDQSAKVSMMKKVIREIAPEYDYILIDVSPSPNWGQFLALSSSDFAIVPMLPDITSLEADNGIIETVEEVKDSSNSKLVVLGLLFNRNDNRTNLSKQVKMMAARMADRLNTKVFDTKIRNAVSMGENVYYHIGITEYDSRSAVAGDIRALVEEIEREVEKNG